MCRSQWEQRRAFISQLNWSEAQTERFASGLGWPTATQLGFQAGLETPAYLSKGALHPTQEVIVASSDAVSAVDVVDFKPELLHLLEVVVQWKDLGKHRVQVALYDFCPVQLREERQKETSQTRDCQRTSGGFQRSIGLYKRLRALWADLWEFLWTQTFNLTKACTPLFNSLTRKAELFAQLLVWDLACEHLWAAQLLTRANQSALINYLFSFTVKELWSCVCGKCVFRTERADCEEDCFFLYHDAKCHLFIFSRAHSRRCHDDHINPAPAYWWILFSQKPDRKH